MSDICKPTPARLFALELQHHLHAYPSNFEICYSTFLHENSHWVLVGWTFLMWKLRQGNFKFVYTNEAKCSSFVGYTYIFNSLQVIPICLLLCHGYARCHSECIPRHLPWIIIRNNYLRQPCPITNFIWKDIYRCYMGYITWKRQETWIVVRMLRWVCGVTSKDKIRNEHIRGTTRVTQASKNITERRFNWYGNVLRRD